MLLLQIILYLSFKLFIMKEFVISTLAGVAKAENPLTEKH